MHETRDAARELRMQGLTFAEIGKRLGVSKQRIAQCCAGMNPEQTAWACHKEDLDCIIYVGLKKWMLENRVSVPEMMRRIGLDTGSSRSEHFKNRLKGKTQLSITEIKKILAVTGGTFEQMFTTD
jgi:hypothetical protein